MHIVTYTNVRPKENQETRQVCSETGLAKPLAMSYHDDRSVRNDFVFPRTGNNRSKKRGALNKPDSLLTAWLPSCLPRNIFAPTSTCA